MSFEKHGKMLIYSFGTWLTFYLIGLPDYYQRLSVETKSLLIIIVTALYFPMTKYTLKKFWDDGRHLKNACWLALYLTVPLFTYDYFLLGLYKGLGIKFVVPFWYLTFFYFSFWIQFPFVAWRMEQKERAAPG